MWFSFGSNYYFNNSNNNNNNNTFVDRHCAIASEVLVEEVS